MTVIGTSKNLWDVYEKYVKQKLYLNCTLNTLNWLKLTHQMFVKILAAHRDQNDSFEITMNVYQAKK